MNTTQKPQVPATHANPEHVRELKKVIRQMREQGGPATALLRAQALLGYYKGVPIMAQPLERAARPKKGHFVRGELF